MEGQFHQLLYQAKQRFIKSDSTKNLRNYFNESYQEFQFLNMKAQVQKLINSIEKLYKLDSSGSVQKCFSYIVQHSLQFSSSLLTLQNNIFGLLKSESRLRISHQNYSSQIILLVLCMRFIEPEQNITVITTKQNIRNWSLYLIDSKSADSQSNIRLLLSSLKITIRLIEQSYKCPITHSNQILILDLMNVDVIVFKPLILVLKQFLSIPQKVIIYHSNIQQNEVDQVLNFLDDQYFTAQASLTYPIQIQYIEKDGQIKKKLIQFLYEDSNHPQKQDIIIFYKNQNLWNSTSNRFSSKLKQILSDKSLLSHVQIITNKNQIIIDGKNHIFIAQNADELLSWNYSYNDVFYVIDYGWETYYKMDHQNNCFIQDFRKSDLKQKTKRLSFVGINKVGRYIYHENELSDNLGYIDRSTQVMTYTLRMIDLGLQSYLEMQNLRIGHCIKNLYNVKAITKSQQGKLSIINSNILKFCELGIDPLQVQIIQNCIQKQKNTDKKILCNSLLMTICVMNIRGNLRQGRDGAASKFVSKPSGIWRKTGYLDSCLQIFTKAQIIQNKKNQSRSISKRKTSKLNQEQNEVHSKVYEQMIPHKMQFEEMNIQDLLRQYFVNPTLFAQIREKLDQLRQIFQIQQTNIKLENNLVQQILQQLIKVIPSSVAIFSGIRRTGYLYSHNAKKKTHILSDKDSLMSQLNQTPQCIVVLRCSEHEGRREMLMCTNLNQQLILNGFEHVLTKKSQQLAEQQIQFHGISSSIFKGLFRNNEIQMKKFEKQFDCFVEPNEQMATIFLYCSKEISQKVKTAFEDLISKIKDKFVNSNKIIHYLGNTNVSMSNGGQIKEIIKDNYINECYLNNLDLEVTEEDLEQLFDEFFVLKSIEVLSAQTGKLTKSALIQFNSQKDYYRFHNYYNECLYFDRLLQVKPIVKKTSNAIETEKYIDFKWYVWKSHQKALVYFKNSQSAQKAFQSLKQNSKLDGSPVKFSIDKTKITLQNLNKVIDEIFLQKQFSIYGQIKQVQILKTPLKQITNQQNMIDKLLRQTLQIPLKEQLNERFKIFPIEKHKNGLRKCKVIVRADQHLNKIIQSLNRNTGKIGQGRLYAESIFTKPILIVYPSVLSLYQQLFQETINEMPQKPNISYTIKDQANNRLYMILKSPMNDTLKFISTKFQKKLQPFQIQLTEQKKNVILSDIGISNLIDLQEKFNCKLVVNSLKKILSVICKQTNVKQIKQEITSRVNDKFFYRISLNNRSYKNLFHDKTKLNQIKTKYQLTLLQIEEYSKTLIFEGSANQVQSSLNYMMHVIESFSKSEEQMINSQVCLICYQEPFRPYRLQNCGHKFCFGCLDQCINSVLGDITMFPIKCPHCVKQLTIDDLQSLIDVSSWPKLITMATNHYVNKNPQIMTFCYTPGCKQINILKLKYFRCDMCATIYCTDCKQKSHEGLTCQQAKLGSDLLFKKYMQQNGVRTCPNKSCKMPIVRTDGCFRVTCSRCNKSMCFKCDPKKMVAYETSTECYNHLNTAHGGYW